MVLGIPRIYFDYCCHVFSGYALCAILDNPKLGEFIGVNNAMILAGVSCVWDRAVSVPVTGRQIRHSRFILAKRLWNFCLGLFLKISRYSFPSSQSLHDVAVSHALATAAARPALHCPASSSAQVSASHRGAFPGLSCLMTPSHPRR